MGLLMLKVLAGLTAVCWMLLSLGSHVEIPVCYHEATESARLTLDCSDLMEHVLFVLFNPD